MFTMDMLISGKEMLHIIQRTLNHVDPRLVQHGARVAWLVLKMMQTDRCFDLQRVKQVCMLAMLHDVGAYKTEEIDRFVTFETENVWQHSIYGYLFLAHFSPLKELAPAVLYHHADMSWLVERNVALWELAQLISLADRLDIFVLAHGMLPDALFLEEVDQGKFAPSVVATYMETSSRYPDLLARLQDGQFTAELEDCLETAAFSEEEIDAYLRMLVYSIDFRSPHTVTHTMTTERISVALSTRLGLSDALQSKIRSGAVLHDLGKIGIPVEVLEFPGKLSAQAMRVMRTHVTLTESILGTELDREIYRIAVRHHEKLNGMGYPSALRSESLTLAERIVAVADITSALGGTRSYKDAFSKERSISIIVGMKDAGELCPVVVEQLLSDYDKIMQEVEDGCAPLLATYTSIQAQYQTLLAQMTGAFLK